MYRQRLGYRIDAEAGRHGGYRLASGSSMPPLVLDGEEALAVALGLRATIGVRDLGSAAVTALAKLATTVPTHVRAQLEAVAGIEVAPGRQIRSVDPNVLAALASLPVRRGRPLPPPAHAHRRRSIA